MSEENQIDPVQSPENLDSSASDSLEKENGNDPIQETLLEDLQEKDDSPVNEPVLEKNAGKPEVGNDVELLKSEFHHNDPYVEMVTERLDALRDQFTSLKNEFVSKLKYDAHKDQIIDRLHQELQGFKNGILEKLIRPIVMDLIHLHDDGMKLAQNLEEKDPEELTITKLIKLLKETPLDISDVLYRNVIESYTCDEKIFNPKLQKAAHAVETDHPGLDKHICERIKKGFTYQDKILRPEIVSVFRFKKPEINTDLNHTETNE